MDHHESNRNKELITKRHLFYLSQHRILYLDISNDQEVDQAIPITVLVLNFHSRFLHLWYQALINKIILFKIMNMIFQFKISYLLVIPIQLINGDFL